MAEHSISIGDRKEMTVTGVTELVGFDSETVVMETKQGRLTVEGSMLSINDLSTDSGKLGICGQIDSVAYSQTGEKGSGFFARLFR